MSIVAYMPGSSLRSGLPSVARTCTLRELASTCGLIAVILPANVWPGIGIDLRRDRLADPDLVQRLLRQEEVDIDRIERLQGHDGGAGSQILADIDRADAEMAGERRAQHLLVDHRLLLLDLRARVLQVEVVDVHDRLADRLRLQLLRRRGRR